MIILNNNDIIGAKLGNSDVKLYIGDNKIYELDPFNGFEYVDLGLPSGTLWAKCNVGASNETDYGSYYMYGKGTTVYNDSDSRYNGTEDPLSLSLDTARQVMGGSWHIPTKNLFLELISNTTYLWVNNFNNSGINGYKFIASNNNYIFLPAAGSYFYGSQSGLNSNGSYWSSTPYNESRAYYLNIAEAAYSIYNLSRSLGSSIRGVIG